MSTTPDSLVIVNTSPRLYLHQVGCLELLRQLYSTIAVPSAVRQELEIGWVQLMNFPKKGNSVQGAKELPNPSLK